MNNNQGNQKQQNRTRPPIPIWYALAAIGLMLVVQNVLFAKPYDQIPYSEFRVLLHAGKVEEVQIGTQTIRGEFRQPTHDTETRGSAAKSAGGPAGQGY